MSKSIATTVRAFCVDASGVVLAESRCRNIANAMRAAQWLLAHVDDAARAFAPRAQYEVCR